MKERVHRWIAAVATVALVAGAMSLPVSAAPKRGRISINDVQISEGNTGEKLLTFTVQIKGPNTAQAAVDWATSPDTATANEDYRPRNGTVSFAAAKQRQVGIPIIGDEVVEPNETFDVSLSNAVNATIAKARGVGTILNDDVLSALPTLSIADDTIGEGDTGTSTASFEVSLSEPAASAVTVDYATANGSANAPADYASNTGSLTFLPGDTTEFVTIDVKGDATNEADEDFTVTLSNAVGAAIPAASSSATGTIIDDEGAPAISVEDAFLTEGNSGSTTATFTVSLSHDSASQVTIDYATAPDEATSPDDFAATQGSLNFDPGEVSKDVTVAVVADIVDEADERFTIGLANPQGAQAADIEGRGFITDDDTSRVSASNTTATEGGGPAAFTVTLSKPSSQNVTVFYATADGTAKATTDYRTLSGSLSFSSGQSSKTVNVGLVDDRVHERLEAFSLTLTQTLNAELGDGVGSATIRDNDRAPTTTTLKARKRSGRIRASGRLSPAHKGRRMEVTLKKRSDGRWVKVRTKRPLLTRRIDLNGDGVRDSRYGTRFFNPRNTKRCRVTARFPGDLHHRPSKARKTFNC